MSTKFDFYHNLVLEVLDLSKKTLEELGEEGVIEVKDERVTDISTRGDRLVSAKVIELLRSKKIPARFYDEEAGMIDISPNPSIVITLDDIDGTDNYHRGRGILPYGSIVSIFDSPNPLFKDAIAAGVDNNSTKSRWLAFRGEGCYLNGKITKTSSRKVIDESTVLAVDRNSTKLEKTRFSLDCPLVWMKDYCAAGFHFAGVSSGIFDAFISPRQKGHELGAGYLLVKEAGGVVTDFKGNSIENAKYDFNAKYKIIAVATSELAREIVEHIR